VPDLRGAGATDAPGGRYDLATMRGDPVVLMDALGLERASIVAHDWSALAGFSLCLEHPDRVSRYVAIAVPPPYIRISPALLWAMVKAMRHLWFQYAVAPGIGPRLLAGGQQRLATWILRFFEVQPIPDEDVAAYLAVLREPAHARAASALYRQLILPEFIKIIRGSYRGRRLQVPTLVLFGAEDQLIPKDAMRFHEDDARVAAGLRTRRCALPRRRPAGGGGSARGGLFGCVTPRGSLRSPFRDQAALADQACHPGSRRRRSAQSHDPTRGLRARL
jgi:pimeloyl-ACP methyl ester carboxylesterase